MLTWLVFASLLNGIYLLESDTIYFEDETEEAKELLDNYAMLIGSAAKDTTDYSKLTGILSKPEGRAMYYYTKHPPASYLTEFRTTYLISLKVSVYLLRIDRSMQRKR